MRVALITAPGVPDNLVVEQRPEPVPVLPFIAMAKAVIGGSQTETK